MKNITPTRAAIACILAANFFVSCSKGDIAKPVAAAPAQSTTASTTDATISAPDPALASAMATTTTASTAPYLFSINYGSRPNGSYGLAQASTDYKNISYWMGTGTSIYNGMLTTNLAKGVVGINGGTLTNMNVPDASEYTVSFRMMFSGNFDFSYGGKVGFGALIGNGYTGGTPGWDGNGGSARLMWYKGAGGRVYLKPYIYHKDQAGVYGDDFAKTFPASGSLSKGVWYAVKMYVKSNTGSNKDGRIMMSVNGVTLIDQAIRWTTNDANRLINNIVFETFRGGAESYWQSATDGQIHFNTISYGVGKL